MWLLKVIRLFPFSMRSVCCVRQRQGELFHFAVLLHVTQNFLPLAYHVEVELREYWGTRTKKVINRNTAVHWQDKNELQEILKLYEINWGIGLFTDGTYQNKAFWENMMHNLFVLELKRTGDVGDHDEDEEGVVVKGEVVVVRQGDGVEPCFLHVW